MWRLRPTQKPNERLLLVKKIGEQERRRYGPLPDAVFYDLLGKVLSDHPRLVGVDIYRPDARGKLATLLRTENRRNGAYIRNMTIVR
jgi:CHASE2 domain-containing sensor protein